MKVEGQTPYNWWLDNLQAEGKDPADPTYLMQAFNLARKKALEVIQEWQLDEFPTQGKGDDNEPD